MQWHQTRRSNGTNRFTDQCLPISWIKHTVAACVIISAVVKRRQRCNSRWIYRIKNGILAEARDFVATEFNRSTRSSISILFILERLICNSVIILRKYKIHNFLQKLFSFCFSSPI